MDKNIVMEKGAILSSDRTYRYSLWRIWDKSLPKVLFIMLNPSTADEDEDDKTITRCIGFAKSWGYGGLYVCNLYAFRTKSPKVLKEKSRYFDVISKDNFSYLNDAKLGCAEVIFAWGANVLNTKGHLRKVLDLIPNGKCLGKTQNGFPKHPLYLKGDLKPVLFEQKTIGV